MRAQQRPAEPPRGTTARAGPLPRRDSSAAYEEGEVVEEKVERPSVFERMGGRPAAPAGRAGPASTVQVGVQIAAPCSAPRAVPCDGRADQAIGRIDRGAGQKTTVHGHCAKHTAWRAPAFLWLLFRVIAAQEGFCCVEFLLQLLAVPSRL